MIAWMQFGAMVCMRRLLVTTMALVAAFQSPPADLSAAPMAYSGKLTVWGFAHDGPGHFRFQLVDHNGSVLWQNAADGSAVTTQVNRGHYSVLLGDDAAPHMAAIPENLFLDHPVVFLRVHFSQGDGKPFVHLQPDQRILSAAPRRLPRSLNQTCMLSPLYWRAASKLSLLNTVLQYFHSPLP
mgnify:CR=1 FL=1